MIWRLRQLSWADLLFVEAECTDTVSMMMFCGGKMSLAHVRRACMKIIQSSSLHQLNCLVPRSLHPTRLIHTWLEVHIFNQCLAKELGVEWQGFRAITDESSWRRWAGVPTLPFRSAHRVKKTHYCTYPISYFLNTSHEWMICYTTMSTNMFEKRA